jgi:hypothetical protein
MATLEETLKKLGLAAARGVPQLATGFVDLAALPFTMTGVMKPEQAVGSTAYLTSKGLLPPPQEGLLSETTELVSSAVNPATATKAALAKGGLLAAPMLSVGKKATTGAALEEVPTKFFQTGIVDEKIGDSRVSYQLGDDGILKIFSLRTPQSKRGQGSATEAMNQIVQRADEAGIPIKLDASPLDKKTRLDKLVKFYQKFGFELTGEKVNALGEPVMIRNPQVSR